MTSAKAIAMACGELVGAARGVANEVCFFENKKLKNIILK